MNAESFFSPEEKRRIEDAVACAERTTSGEIVPMIVSASGRYAEVEMAGLVAGLGAGVLAALLLHDPWAPLYAQFLWPLIGGVLGFVACSVPAIKRLLVPRARIERAVALRALAAFAAHGIHLTREHTGILILVSLLEHRVEVLADRGINEKVPPGTWDEIVQTITEGLKSGQACDALCRAIARCGEILARHFPRAADDRDELANKLVTES
ncbi:MAG TPA: TPM domain-containing protein [candidate division Zixibacteria bacterium]|nr:TPM domain-containing protein [candidate division Zixibacteria bacterium]